MKKKNISYIAIALLWGICLTSCYDDKSTYADKFIDVVMIDTTGIKSEHFVGYLEQLDLAPVISSKTGANLTYEWALTELPKNQTEYEVISTEKEFHEIISRPITSSPYTLKLTVTDTSNDNLQYLCTWKVYVQSSFIGGLLISDTKDGETSDFTYIKNSTLTENYTKEEKLYRHILEEVNGTSYNGLMTSLTYETLGNAGGTLTNQVWAITSTGYCSRFLCEDFSENGNSDSENLLPFKPEGFEFQSLFKGYQFFFANTNNGIYSFNQTAVNLFAVPDPVAAGYTINNEVVTTNSSISITSNNYAVWLDKEKGQLIAYSGSSTFGTSRCEPYAANTIFDPNAMKDKSAIAAITSEDGDLATFLLKDDQTGNYDIYTLSRYVDEEMKWDDILEEYVTVSPAIPASAKNKYTIPESGKTLLNRAISVFFAKKENVIYVATSEGVYAITFGVGDSAVVTTTPKFTPPTGEAITKVKLYQQGHYVNNVSSVVSNDTPPIPQLPWNNKAIIIATQKSDTEGKVYVVPMKQIGTGNLDPSNALSYDGFGKILDVTTIGY